MVSYFLDIWKARHFWMSLVRMDLRTRYRRSVLGIGWSLLQPIAMTTITCLAFAKIMKMDIQELAPHILSGFAFWNFLVGCATAGCLAFFSNESYIRQCPQPLAIYPLRVVLGAGFHFLMAYCVVVMGTGIVTGRPPNLEALALNLVPTFLLLFVFTWSLATLTALGTVFFQDTAHLTEVFFQMLFYMTPIIYPVKVLVENRLEWMVWANPVTPFLELVRGPAVYGITPSAATYIQAFITTLLAAGLAILLMRRHQKSIIFQL